MSRNNGKTKFSLQAKKKTKKQKYSMWSLVRDFSEHDKIFRPEKYGKKMNASADLLISLLSLATAGKPKLRHGRHEIQVC